MRVKRKEIRDSVSKEIREKSKEGNAKEDGLFRCPSLFSLHSSLFTLYSLLLTLLFLPFFGCKKEREAPVRYTTELQKAKEKAEHSKNVADKAILKAAISSFYSREQRYPANLQELVSAGFLQSVPSGWEYDPSTGEVK